MLLAAQTAAEGQGGILGTLGSFLTIILMFVVFYFVLIRPQRKKEKETQEMLASLKAGDNVTTIGGICGKIVSVKDDILTVEVGADKVKLVFERWAIRDVNGLKKNQKNQINGKKLSFSRNQLFSFLLPGVISKFSIAYIWNKTC